MISPEQAQYFFTNSEDSICVISSAGELIYTNPSAEKLFGISAKEGAKIWNAIPYVEGNDDLIQLFIDAVMNKVSSHEAILDYWNNQGQVHNIHVKMTCYNKDPLVYLIVITDLTQLMKVNSALIRYTSPDIADYVLLTAEGQKSGGSTRTVTILMSDLRGFTTLSTLLKAEELITVLNHYFAEMVTIIRKYNGTVIEFLGDGLFTVFGAPKDLSDHAELAVKCAVEMQMAMKKVNEWNLQNGYPNLEMGIGINTGNAVVGNIGSEQAMKYGCMGATVNIAGRVESLTIGGQVLITENTKELINDDLNIASEGSFRPKGIREELKYYEINGICDLIIDIESNKEIVWLDHTEETEFSYYLLDGKRVSDKENTGKIIRLSENKRFALFDTKTALAAGQNIMLNKEGKSIYAKVIRNEEAGSIICFTSIPIT